MALTRAQIALYWREWSACKKVRAARGLCVTDEARHALHREALGRECSMLELGNDDLTRVLGAFRAFSRPDDINAQFHAIDDPKDRRDALERQAYELLDEMQLLGKRWESTDHRENYLNQMAWAMFKKPLRQLDHAQMAKLFYSLSARVRGMKRKQQETSPATPHQEAGNSPF